MNSFIIVSYATKDTPYEDVLDKYLLASVRKLSLPYYVDIVPDLGDWYKNTAFKPRFIMDCLRKFKEDIVFLDADATVEQYPQLFHDIPEEYDMALHYLDWKAWYHQPSIIFEALSGTLYLRNNNRIADMVTKWAESARASQEWEQKALAKVLKENPEVIVYSLPLDYCYIKTLPKGQDPFVKIDQPVILHHQVSRYLKRRQGWKLLNPTKLP